MDHYHVLCPSCWCRHPPLASCEVVPQPIYWPNEYAFSSNSHHMAGWNHASPHTTTPLGQSWAPAAADGSLFGMNHGVTQLPFQNPLYPVSSINITPIPAAGRQISQGYVYSALSPLATPPPTPVSPPPLPFDYEWTTSQPGLLSSAPQALIKPIPFQYSDPTADIGAETAQSSSSFPTFESLTPPSPEIHPARSFIDLNDFYPSFPPLHDKYTKRAKSMSQSAAGRALVYQENLQFYRPYNTCSSLVGVWVCTRCPCSNDVNRRQLGMWAIRWPTTTISTVPRTEDQTVSMAIAFPSNYFNRILAHLNDKHGV